MLIFASRMAVSPAPYKLPLRFLLPASSKRISVPTGSGGRVGVKVGAGDDIAVGVKDRTVGDGDSMLVDVAGATGGAEVQAVTRRPIKKIKVRYFITRHYIRFPIRLGSPPCAKRPSPSTIADLPGYSQSQPAG
jgi:hypothetical protein